LPLRGFGMVAAWYPGAIGFYLKPGMFTPYSDDTGSTISDFFSKNEYFYMLEAGFSSLAQSGTPIQARGAMDVDNIHVTGWYRDALPDGSPRATASHSTSTSASAPISCGSCAPDGPRGGRRIAPGR
jgi:hypothetical protein